MWNSENVQLGRAKNAVLSFLEQRLSIPKIYIDAEWAGHKIDVLAINRDGVGDVHAVLLFPRKYFLTGERNGVHQGDAVEQLVEKFASIPAQYKYIGAVETNDDPENSYFRPSARMNELFLSPDGLGRIGFLTVESQSDAEPRVSFDIKPERFRAKVAALADAYIAQHEADWEIRT